MPYVSNKIFQEMLSWEIRRVSTNRKLRVKKPKIKRIRLFGKYLTVSADSKYPGKTLLYAILLLRESEDWFARPKTRMDRYMIKELMDCWFVTKLWRKYLIDPNIVNNGKLKASDMQDAYEQRASRSCDSKDTEPTDDLGWTGT